MNFSLLLIFSVKFRLSTNQVEVNWMAYILEVLVDGYDKAKQDPHGGSIVRSAILKDPVGNLTKTS